LACSDHSFPYECVSIPFNHDNPIWHPVFFNSIYPRNSYDISCSLKHIFVVADQLKLQGEARDRVKVGFIGSSFYIFLTVFFIVKYVTIKPKFPGDDTFIRSIGSMFGIIVTLVTCFS
jgi:hypothetical protein